MTSFDKQKQYRTCTVAFKISPEKKELLRKYVQLSGLTEREYVASRALQTDVVVRGNSRVYKALKGQMEAIYTELQRINQSEEISKEFAELIKFTLTIYREMKEDN